MRLACAIACDNRATASAGALLVFGQLVTRTLFVGGQAVGSAWQSDDGPEMALWAVMPVVKYYPVRYLYVGGAVGRGEADGSLPEGRVKHGIWAAEARVGWTVPRHPVLTPYLSYFRVLQRMRVETTGELARRRAEYVQIGIALSTPGSRPGR